ncbi:MAG: hypothetical protein H6718_19715 [Polyangiaceae bacterium]|nr:hypothetical protein [Polyangiaceae bacterium]
MSAAALRDQFPANLRKQWEIDRILIEEPRPDGSGTRLAIDLRAGYSPTQRGMGSGSPFLSRKVPVEQALVAMSPHLEGATIERVDLWGANLNNAALDALLDAAWFRGVRILNLGASRLTSKAVASLAAHPLAKQLEDLTLSYNKLGNAFAKLEFPELTSLELVYCGVDDRALIALGDAALPKLERLMLEGAATHVSLATFSRAAHDGSPPPRAEYSAKALEDFGQSPLGKRLTTLGLGSLTLGVEQMRAVAASFETLKTLDLTAAKLSAAAVKALGEGQGLNTLQRLVLTRSFAPNYGMRADLQAPTQETADALASLARGNFASSLKDLVLNEIAVGPLGLNALCGASLQSLQRLEARNCQLGDEGLAALGGGSLPLNDLLVDGNKVTETGVSALAQGPLAERLQLLALTTNPIGDGGAKALAGFKSLKRLSLSRCGLTDVGARALAAGPVQGLEALFLGENLISDSGAKAIVDVASEALKPLALQKNCLSPAGVKQLQATLGDRAFLGDQDPSKLPPACVDNPALVFKATAHRTQPAHTAPIDGLRKQLPDGQLSRDKAYPGWIFAFPKSENGEYLALAYDTERDLLVRPDPPIVNGLPCVVPSPDGEWLAVKAFCDGIYAVRTADGTSTRIADTLSHQQGGVVFCDGRIVALDADTEADDWQGRLQVFGFENGEWVLEHSVTGFFEVFDDIVPLANHRMFAVIGDAGMFFRALRGKELRYLGRLNKKYPLFDFEGQPTLNPTHRTTAVLGNVDALLDEAFAQGRSPTSIHLPEDAWG